MNSFLLNFNNYFLINPIDTMKKISLLITTAILMGMSIQLSSCSKDDDDDEVQDFTVTQADLDATISVFETDVTGAQYGTSSIAHNGNPDMTADDTFRDIYTNLASNTDGIEIGTIIAKHTFAKNDDGTKGDLLATFAMVKRKANYFADGGDWEYMMIPNDGTSDYESNPNGLIASAAARGELTSCGGCHAAGGDDFLFIK